MIKYNVSRSAVKNAVARLGLTNALAPNALIKYAQGAAFVWSLESTSGSQAVYDNYKEKSVLLSLRMAPSWTFSPLITRYSHRTTYRKRCDNHLRSRLKRL